MYGNGVESCIGQYKISLASHRTWQSIFPFALNFSHLQMHIHHFVFASFSFSRKHTNWNTRNSVHANVLHFSCFSFSRTFPFFQSKSILIRANDAKRFLSWNWIQTEDWTEWIFVVKIKRSLVKKLNAHNLLNTKHQAKYPIYRI